MLHMSNINECVALASRLDIQVRKIVVIHRLEQALFADPVTCADGDV